MPTTSSITWADAVSGAAYAKAAAPKQSDPQPQQPQDRVTVGEPGPEPFEKVLDSETVAAIVSGSMKNGETVTIKSDGQVVLEIKKEGLTKLDKFAAFASDTIKATAAEVSNVVSQDPSFAFKEAALLVKDQVYSGVPAEFTSYAEQAFLPMIRVVAIALDVKKAIDTYKSERASKTDRMIDGGHLLTDVAGLAGAISFAIPGVSGAVRVGLTAAGLVGDVAAYGYHVMKYFRERGLPDVGAQQNGQQNPQQKP